MMTDRKKTPFTVYEKELLREIAAPYLGVIECRKTDGAYTKKKNEAWMEIAVKFNASPQCCQATLQQLKKLWLNMKAKARDVKTAAKQRLHTGGGPYMPDLPPEDDILGGVLDNVMPSIKVPMDSDGVGDAGADDDDNAWRQSQQYAEPMMNEDDDGIIITEYVVQNTPNEHVVPNTPNEQNQQNQQNQQNRQNEHNQQNEQSQQNQRNERNQQNLASKAKKSINKIDSLKSELIEKDIKQRESEFHQKLSTSQKIDQVKLDMMTLELNHKRKYYAMIEEEQAIEIEHNKKMFEMIEREQALCLKKVQKENQCSDYTDENLDIQ